MYADSVSAFATARGVRYCGLTLPLQNGRRNAGALDVVAERPAHQT
jgi:hypothetical protein